MRFRLVESLLMEDLVDAKKYYPNISQEDFDRVIALDPTFNRAQDKLGTYGKWLLKLFTKKALDDEHKVHELLVDFDANKNNLKDRDIMKYTSIDDLESMLNDDDSYKELSRRQSLRQVQKKVHKTDVEQDAQKVFENDNWIVYVPKTYEASCKLGRGTSWCTATTESDNYYKRYTNEGKLYININKKDPSEKYQFHFETQSYMDSDDSPIDIIDFFVENVDLFNFYKTIIGNDATDGDNNKIIPAVSFLIENSSDTFIYSKDNAELFEKYGTWLSSTLKHLIIDKSVSVIPESAFYNFTELQTVEIQDGVTSIGNFAFSGCESLTSITIPNSVTSIGDYAIEACTSLTSITIPDSVTSIGVFAFEVCTNLVNITIPNSLTSISNSVFYGCSGLTSITIPNSVMRIGSDAFSGCNSLTSVTIGNSVTRIGSYAFNECISLTSITIPDGVTRIGYRAFYGCTGLISIVMPDSVTSIGDSAFRDCSNLKKVYYDGTKKQWDSILILAGNDDLLKSEIVFNSI